MIVIDSHCKNILYGQYISLFLLRYFKKHIFNKGKLPHSHKKVKIKI